MKKSDIKLDPISESSIKIKVSKKDKKKKKKQLQRNKKWREERRGSWTGSQLKSLMSCSAGKGQMSWGNVDKLYAFGLTALKYIYENAMERKTGRYIDDGDGSWAMQYGTKVEPLIDRAVKEKLKELGVKGKLKDVGFKKFPSIPNAGVSSDKILVSKKGETIATLEYKACTNWQTHYERVFSLTDEKSKDFWQIQGQTIAHNVKTCYYAVAEPPNNIKDYLFYNGNIMDLYDQFKKECKVSIEIVKASKQHQKALLKRIIIAEDTLSDWLSMGGNLKKNLEDTITIYEKNPENFNKYIVPLMFNEKPKKKLSFSKKKILLKKKKTQ